MKNELYPLPYTSEALEPVISRNTIEHHYDKHLQGYVNNLTRLTAGTEYENQSVEDIVRTAPDGGIYNNAGQVLNHTLYFRQFMPDPIRKKPAGKLAEAIDRTFGDFEKFKEQFNQKGATLFGSGWVWLASDDQGALTILQESNAGIPLRQNLTPILCFDVWEHAYYLDYQNKRADYLQALWNIINWEEIENRYPNRKVLDL